MFVPSCFVGTTSTTTYKGSDKKYADIISSTKILVTANPGEWEGDSRLWESLAGGALVFVDEMHTPLSFGLHHGEHVVHYIGHDTKFAKEKFRLTLDMYLKDDTYVISFC